MKRFVLSLFSVPVLVVFLFSALAGAETRLFTVSGGIAKTVGARWSETGISTNKYLSYSMKSNDYTMIEGEIANNKTGLALGVNADLDNNYIGQANRVAGYIGFKQLSLRYQTGKISGTARWTGQLAPGQKTLTPFDGAITHVDLVYWLAKMPMYFGLGYTSYAIPVEALVSTTRLVANVKIFDPDYRASYYSFIFGFDSFSSSLMYLNAKNLSAAGQQLVDADNKPWRMFFTTQDRFGFGSSNVSAKGVAAALALNPGVTSADSAAFSTFIENSTSVGVRWRGLSPYGQLAVGLGYEVAFNVAIDFGSSGSKSRVGFSPMSSLLRYGPVLRLYMQY